jgi:hypothetical protein
MVMHNLTARIHKIRVLSEEANTKETNSKRRKYYKINDGT